MQHLDELTVQGTAPLKILLAEDNRASQKLALRQLQLLGYQADAVTNGKAAIEAAIQSHYDLILMDCQMPILDGFAATEAIRYWEQQQLSRHRQTIVVAMTASDLSQDRERAIAVGMDDFLTKPVRKEILAALLSHWSQILTTNLCASRLARLDAFRLLPASLQRLPGHLDLDHLHRLSDHKSEFEVELLHIFLEDSRRQLEILKQAVFRQDKPKIQQSIHHIRGASANVGAKVMQFVAERLEDRVQHVMQPEAMQPEAMQLEIAMMQELIAKLEFSLAQVQMLVNQMNLSDKSA
jgi:CheY-like chemotaxis protein/HPt (histidine-containing phosphotransfer) domain-containing protein